MATTTTIKITRQTAGNLYGWWGGGGHSINGQLLLTTSHQM